MQLALSKVGFNFDINEESIVVYDNETTKEFKTVEEVIAYLDGILYERLKNKV